jgi:signal transduction histidine kinase
MQPTSGFRSLGVLLFPFLLIVCLFSGALAWLGWRVLEQDRALANQRVLERLGAGADAVGTLLLRNILAAEDLLGQIDAAPESTWSAGAVSLVPPPACEAVVVVFRHRRVTAFPSHCLKYYPVTPSGDTPAAVFDRGEMLEYRHGDYPAAAASFRRAARSADPAVRAGALVRLARTLRKSGQGAEALAVYTQLAQAAPARLGDVPADLVARHARCSLLAESQQREQLRAEAALLEADLQQGRWQLTQSAYRLHLDDVRRWAGTAPIPSGELEALAIATATSALWDEWLNQGRRDRVPVARRVARFDGRPVLTICRGNTDRLVALLAGGDYVDHRWLSRAQPTLARLNLRLALTDNEGHAVGRTPLSSAAFRVVRSPAESGLPWTLHVTSADAGADLAQFTARRRFVVAGFALVIALIAVAGYVTARAVARELAVARMQSEFVSAVSHEFRTPLTSLRQLSELLADGRVPDEQRRRAYYEDLGHESERLQRLVENLLEFGRIEAGAREYRLETVDAGALVRQVAGDFEREVAGRGYRVEVTAGDGLPRVEADREALARALWNLLDNAVRYSPDAKTVWVDARAEAGTVRIAVRDEGLGIAREDQGRIFGKFVRGRSARTAGIKGTGLGLAMVQHIVTAHHGTVRLVSAPGRGSAFTIVLPAAS